MAMWGWERFFEEIQTFLDREASTANLAFTDYVVERLAIAIVNCSTLIDHLSRTTSTVDEEEADIIEHYREELSDIVSNLREISQQWNVYRDQYTQRRASTSYRPDVLGTPRGRPKFDISKEQFEYLKSMNFSWTQVAELLGVSIMTIYRRRQEFGMLGATNEFVISDEELRTVLHQMRHDLPNIGETMSWGYIKALGIKVTRQKLRDAIRDTDPLHTALRWKGELARRRPYSVAGTNSLWHIGEFA